MHAYQADACLLFRMDWTDVHFRQLARLISKHTWLWTEMVVDKTIIHTDRLDSHLWFPPEQRPLVLQMGGSDPASIHAAGRKAAVYGYDEVNLNCGCPSDRVAHAGCFGATLMLEPECVAQCMKVRHGASIASSHSAVLRRACLHFMLPGPWLHSTVFSATVHSSLAMPAWPSYAEL
jgi:hypothetical protein